MKLATPLTPLQQYLVRAFAYTDDDETYEIIDLLNDYFQKKTDQEFEKVCEEKKLTQKDFDQMLHGHYRLRKQA
jgi:hypothetical protein